MIQLSEAKGIMFGKAHEIGSSHSSCSLAPIGDPVKMLPVEEAFGYCLRHDIPSKRNIPPFRASVMDGYAVFDAADFLSDQTELTVRGSKTAGDSGDFLDGTNMESDAPFTKADCVRVSTGGPVPSSAVRVVPVENTEVVETDDKGEETIIRIAGRYCPPNAFIREVGSDLRRDSAVLTGGTLLSEYHIGLLAAAGVQDVSVAHGASRCLRVGVMSTGNELVNLAESDKWPDRVVDSNRIVLLQSLSRYSFLEEVIDLGIAPDWFAILSCTTQASPQHLTSRLRDAMERSHVIVTSGGVSMGEKDLLKRVLTHQLGATVHFEQVNLKPGKPLTFASVLFRGQPRFFICLPGNPVSSAVTCFLFVVPFVHFLTGRQRELGRKIFTARVALGSKKDLGRDEFMRAKLTDSGWRRYLNGEYKRCEPDGEGEIRLLDTEEEGSYIPENGIEILEGQQSSRLASFENAHCLLHFPKGHYPPGLHFVHCYMLDHV